MFVCMCINYTMRVWVVFFSLLLCAERTWWQITNCVAVIRLQCSWKSAQSFYFFNLIEPNEGKIIFRQWRRVWYVCLGNSENFSIIFFIVPLVRFQQKLFMLCRYRFSLRERENGTFFYRHWKYAFVRPQVFDFILFI